MGDSDDRDNNASDKQRKVAEDYKKTTGGTYNMNQAPHPGIQPADKNYSRNLDLAKNLDARARGYSPFGDIREKMPGIPVGIQLGMLGLDAIGRFSMRHQANKLKQGGMPVFDRKGKMQGVVSENIFGGLVYSGNAAYSPLGRKNTGFNVGSASYTVDGIAQGDDSASEPNQATPFKTEEKPAGSIAEATGGTKLAQKNQAVEAATGGAATRYFLSRARGRSLG